MEIFQQACEMPADQRVAFLDQACRDQPGLRREVESLLAHHVAATISTKPNVRTTRNQSTRGASPSFQYFPRLGRRLLNLWPILVGLVLLLLLALLWKWVENGVREQLYQSLQDRLTASLLANARAIDQWFTTEKEIVEGWAENPRLKELVGDLISLSQQSASSPSDLRSALANSEAQKALFDLLEPTRDHDGDIGIVVTRWDGIRLFHQDPSQIGVRIETSYFSILERVVGGATVLFRPSTQISRVVGYDPEVQGPITAVVAPIRGIKEDGDDENGKELEVIAAIAFAFAADEELTERLATARPGKTGETYAFVENEILLSSLHSAKTLQELQRKNRATPTSDSPLSMLSERDNRHRFSANHSAVATLTPTLRSRFDSSTDSNPLHLNREGYQNYRGQEVVGAWTSLPQHEFSIATEMEKSEAYAPLTYVTTAFRWLFGFVSLLTLATFLSSLTIAYLRNRVKSATQLGPYTLRELLGQGGMGKVYRAQHAILRRPTAVKLLEGDHADPESVKRFEREVQLTSQLTHPNTIQIYDFGRSPEGIFYYAMEYLDGPTLAQLMVLDRRLPVARIIHILRQVCGSLREAHQSGLVHRDIKPQNIMLCCRGGMYDFVKVLDFGLVKSISSPSDELTRPATISGTPAYIAPERVDDPDHLDGRSDLYSLGAVAYYLLTGHEVFRGKSAVDVLVQAMQKDPPRPRGEFPGIPAELDALVVQCLAKEPADRPATVDHVLDVLDSLAEQMPWPQSAAASWWKDRWQASKSTDQRRKVAGKPESAD
jgi:hypothetical protein